MYFQVLNMLNYFKKRFIIYREENGLLEKGRKRKEESKIGSQNCLVNL